MGGEKAKEGEGGELFCDGVGGKEAGEGEGEGEGVMEVHWVKGAPHNIEFPRNEEAGKSWRDDGIEPLRWLLLKFKILSLGRLKSGMDPMRELF